MKWIILWPADTGAEKHLTLNTLISVCILSILFSKYFLRRWQGEFVCQSREYLVGDNFLYSHNLIVWYCWEILYASHSQGLKGKNNNPGRWAAIAETMQKKSLKNLCLLDTSQAAITYRVTKLNVSRQLLLGISQPTSIFWPHDTLDLALKK